MPPPASRRRSLVALLAVAVVAACDRAREPRANDTPAATPSAGGVVVEPPVIDFHGWSPAEAGPVLGVAAGSVETSLLVLPQYTDSTLTTATTFDVDTLRGLAVELFAPSGQTGTARLRLVDAPPRPGCTGWPVAEVVSDSALPPWTVAFRVGAAAPLPLDSLPALTPRDSARAAAEVTRVASGLPEPADSPFSGLPFVVRSARRFTPEPGRDAFAAHVVRRRGVEAAPLAEHLFIVAERPRGVAGARWQPVYVERTQGAEETVEATEVLAAVRLGAERRPTLVLVRDFGDGTAYALLERGDDGRWRVRWSSAYAGC